MPPPYLTHKKVCIRPNQLDVENNTHRCVYVLFSAYGPDGWLYLKQWRRSDLVLPRLGGPHDNRGWEGAHNNEKDLEMRVKQQWSALQQWGQNVSLLWVAPSGGESFKKLMVKSYNLTSPKAQLHWNSVKVENLCQSMCLNCIIWCGVWETSDTIPSKWVM